MKPKLRFSANILRCVAKSFTSLITVRHPFERLLAAYRDCFFAKDSSEYELRKADLFRRRYGLEIIRQHRTEPQSSNSVYATAPTFREFVSYLLATDVAKYNSHWIPISLLCRPCSLSYTIVAKAETFERDN